MLLFISVVGLCIWGIYTIQQRAETDGIFQGFKSLFSLIITVVCFVIIFSGNPYILGIPFVYGLCKHFFKKI